MPVKDTARDAAFAAMRGSSADIVRALRSAHSIPASTGTEPSLASELRSLLTGHGFDVIDGVAGLPAVFRASRRHLDDEAMRNGLRHAHLAFLVRVGADPEIATVEGDSLGAAAIASAVIGLSAALDEEFGTLTVIGFQRDSDPIAMARAGVFDEFDAVLGARPAPAGEGYCYTIGGTGDTLATRSVSVTFAGDDALAESFAQAALEASTEAAEVAIVAVEGARVDLRLTAHSSMMLRELSGRIQLLAETLGEAEIAWGEATDDMIVSRIVARRVKTYADTLGHKMDRIVKTPPGAPTGWGSVSYVAPTFVLNFPFASEPVVRGEQSFAVAAGAADAYDRALTFAECLCMVGLDLVRDMEFRSIADDQLVKTLRAQGIERPHRRWLGVHPVIKTPGENGKKKKGPSLADFRMVRGPGMPDN